MFDYILVGAGLFSLTFTRFINKLNKSAIIFEKRNVIGGNCISSNLYNINVNEYGPHIFHTSNKTVWDIFNEIYPVTNYIHKVYSNITEGEYKGIYNFPINLSLLNRIYNIQTPDEANKLLNSFNLSDKKEYNSFEDKAISLIGNTLYELFFKGYTEKQWKVSPSVLSPSILNRIPIRTNFDDCYYTDIFCGIPKENNWKEFINNIIEKDINEFHFYSSIDINKLGELRSYKKNDNSKIIITSPIDEFFEYKFGKLDYLRTEFETEYININDFQGCPVMNYPSLNIKYTRITEYKHFDQRCNNEGTIIQKEYPSKNEKNPKMYPVLTEENINLYNKYKEYASENYKDIIFAGRLGEYKYYDMDDTIENAYKLVDKLV